MNFTIKQLAKKAFQSYSNQHSFAYANYNTIAGIIQVTSIDNGIYEAKFPESFDDTKTLSKNKDYSNSSNFKDLDITERNAQLILVGTDFQIKVWLATLQIPSGKTSTYQEIAQIINHPRSWRAVANALGQNKIAYFIPCHRVIQKSGKLGGYKWGIKTKLALLKSEGALK